MYPIADFKHHLHRMKNIMMRIPYSMIHMAMIMMMATHL